MSDFFDRSPGQRFSSAPAADVPRPSAGSGQPAGQVPHKTAERYRTSHGWVGALIGIVVVAIVIAMVWFGTRPSGPPGGTPSPTPTPTKPLHTPPPGGQGIDFTASTYHATGYWEILSYSWDAQGVTLNCRITVDTGTLQYSWLALDNTSAQIYPASTSSTLLSGTVGPGQVVSGTVRFNKNRNGTLIILADARGVQITALSVSS